MNRILLQLENKRWQAKNRKDAIIIEGEMIHKNCGGIFKRYSQNPPYLSALYGCSLCGAYFEAEK